VAVVREAVTGPAVGAATGALWKDVAGRGETIKSSVAMASSAAAGDLKADPTADNSKTKVPGMTLLKPKMEEMDFDIPKVCLKCFWKHKLLLNFLI
jgi:hypothetical protein